MTAGLTPDRANDYLVALARVAKAHFLILGHPHLTLPKQATLQALTPGAFLGVAS